MKNDSEAPLFSIIVVCLNSGQKLFDTLDSILGQNFKNFEIIVKDGLSLDGSPERLEEHYTDGRIRFCAKEDQGIYDAMNQAIELAQGEYYLFLNTGDNFYDENVLGKTAEALEKGADIIYGNLYNKSLHSVIYSAPEINDFTCYRNVPCHQTCFYRKSLFETRAYKTKYTVRADYEHFLWCFYERKAVIRYTPLVITAYEGGGYSETKENLKCSARQHREIVLRYMGRKKADRYRLVMLLTLAPLRSAIAGNRHLSAAYNSIKTVLYKMRTGKSQK